ncbi:MAG: phosphoglycolate phosphatase [Pseudomonadota bacterium]
MTANEKRPLSVKAVVIDLDGTLLDTARDLAEAASRMLRELGRPATEVETIKGYIGNGIARLVKRALTGSMDGEPDAALFERALPLYQKHYADVLTLHTNPYPGVKEGLEALRGAGFRLACITNKAEKFTLPLLKEMGLLDFFELVLSGDTLPKKKPDPLPLRHAAAHFGAKPEEVLLIGDSLNDVQAARAAGCPVFCVPYGYNRGKDVRELDPDAVIGNIAEALKLIEKA